MQKTASCLQTANAIVGEGPSTAKGLLYCVDIKRPAIFPFEPDVGRQGIGPCRVRWDAWPPLGPPTGLFLRTPMDTVRGG